MFDLIFRLELFCLIIKTFSANTSFIISNKVNGKYFHKIRKNVWRQAMKEIRITADNVEKFQKEMLENEKAAATINKYVREAEGLKNFLNGRGLTKEILLEYRDMLIKKYQAQTVNGKLSAVNAFLGAVGASDFRLKFFRVQRRAFIDENRELTETEYRRLLSAAKRQGNNRMYCLLMTIAGTGIRISELRFITVKAVKRGRAEIRLKGKTRLILLTKELRSRLLKYISQCGISDGCVFCTRSGRPLDRSNVCHDMKKLCEDASVDPNKVFPHNLRHLFARAFYAVEKNLAHLADVLGHSSIETTRIYVAASAREYEKTLCRMRLII